MKIITTIFAAFLFLMLFFQLSWSSTIIEAQVVRNQDGFGECLISSGFPVPEGLVSEQMIRNGTVRVKVEGNEVAANVSALRGRHHDGTLRSVLIQFQYSMDENDVLPAQVIIDNKIRKYPDPEYKRPTLETVKNNNVIFPVDAKYLVTTNIYFRPLLPAGQGSPAEEKFFTELAEDRFDYLMDMPVDSWWASFYEPGSASIGLWSRTGDLKYWDGAMRAAMRQLDYMSPAPDSGGSAVLANPDGRETSHSRSEIPLTENMCHMIFSYAQMYLLTGYRDFWGIVAASWVNQQVYIRNQTEAMERVPRVGQYDHPRFNYATAYGWLTPAFLIDATVDVSLQQGMAKHWKKENWLEHAGWLINALTEQPWDVAWIPFESGSGERPKGIIMQGEVTATIYSAYYQRFEPPVSDMPNVGFIQIKASSLQGGSFQAGDLEFPNSQTGAVATGPEELDYRNGIVGTRSWSPRKDPNPVFQFAIFPVNFLIDYYLNIYADPRIPPIVKKHTEVTIMQIRKMQKDDTAYGTYGKWGRTTHTAPYDLRNPVRHDRANPWMLPVYARMVAFTLKTHGVDEVVNGKTYTEWYEIFINPANVSPRGNLQWQWRHFGQMYGWQQDAPWMMAQESLLDFGPVEIREPTLYGQIPGDVPDIFRDNHIH